MEERKIQDKDIRRGCEEVIDKEIQQRLLAHLLGKGDEEEDEEELSEKLDALILVGRELKSEKTPDAFYRWLLMVYDPSEDDLLDTAIALFEDMTKDCLKEDRKNLEPIRKAKGVLHA